MGAFISIEIYAGCTIERACEDAQRVANVLRIDCEFTFNGVRCLAVPQGYAGLLAERQQREQGRKARGPMDRRFASSDPRSRAGDAIPAETSEGRQ